MAIFVCTASPLAPIRVTFGPMSSSTGRMRSKACSLPPTMIESFPSRRVLGLPDTGASSIAAPAAETRSATARLTSGGIVLMSAYTAPSRRPAINPSSPEVTSCTAAPSVSIEKTKSQRSPTSRGVCAHRIPFSKSGLPLSAVRFQPVTSCPPASSRSTTSRPIDPSPRNPTISRASPGRPPRRPRRCRDSRCTGRGCPRARRAAAPPRRPDARAGTPPWT